MVIREVAPILFFAIAALVFSPVRFAVAEDPSLGIAIAASLKSAVQETLRAKEPVLEQKPSLELELGSLALTDSSGEELAAEKVKNKRVVLYFWSIYCRGCTPITRELSQMKEEFARNDVALVPIHLFEPRIEKVTGELSRLGINLPLLFAPKGVRDLFSIRLLPASLVFDGSNKLVARFDGMIDSEGLKLELFRRVETSEPVATP